VVDNASMNNFLLFLGSHPILLCVLLIIIFALAFFLGHETGIFRARLGEKQRMQQERKDAVRKSRAVIGGQVSEQLAPFLPDFPCNAGDVRFVGKPVDFVGFVGASEGKSIKEILIIEVKSGKAKLSEREAQIKACVEAGKVRYVEYRIPEA